MTKQELEHVVDQFQFEGRYHKAEQCTFGHINDTYVIDMQGAHGTLHRYVLQRINHSVFKKPEHVMENIEKVTQHLRKSILAAGGDPERETINLIPTKQGHSYHMSTAGNYWRAYVFIQGARTYQTVEKPSHFYNAGKAFGHFQRLLSDFPANSLHETIERFHDTPKRYHDLIAAIEKDTCNRAKDVAKEIAFAEKRMVDTPVILNLIEQDKIPIRVTHNDTKFNNIMIDDSTGEGICVLDLDTVMPGSALYDFGDSIRFGASTAAEDEKDLDKVWMDLMLYKQFTSGFLFSARDLLTSVELEHLAFSAKLLTLECGLRFLTDHLNGDVYFKIHRPNHNLDRTRTQFKLVEDMETKMEEMHSIALSEDTAHEVAAANE